MVSTGSGTALCIMVVCCDWCISIRLLFLCTMVSSGVRWFAVRCWLWRFLIVGIHASGISAPLSLFMLLGLSLMWIASFHFPCVPMVVSVNKLYFVPQRLVSGSVSMFWNHRIPSTCESYIPVVFFHSFLHGLSRFSDVDFAACACIL